MNQNEEQPILKTIEEFRVSGTFGDEEITGKVVGYIKNIIKAIPLGLKTAVLQSWEKVNEKAEEITSNFVDCMKNNPDLSKRVATGALILMMASSFTGCKMNPEADVKSNIEVEQSIDINEEVAKIEYIVEPGDTLEAIISKYRNSGIADELYKVCRDNKIENPNMINVGKELTLDVPVSKLQDFGYAMTFGEVTERQAMEHFIYSAFDVPASEVHPGNHVFWRDKAYVVGNSSNEQEEYSETPLLIKAAMALYDLEIMKGEQAGFYSEDDIKRKESEINSCYAEAIEIAERNTGKKYGVDYILKAPIIAVPMQKVK